MNNQCNGNTIEIQRLNLINSNSNFFIPFISNDLIIGKQTRLQHYNLSSKNMEQYHYYKNMNKLYQDPSIFYESFINGGISTINKKCYN